MHCHCYATPTSLLKIFYVSLDGTSKFGGKDAVSKQVRYFNKSLNLWNELTYILVEKEC